MSKYTTEVRWICEDAYGLTGDESERPSVNTIVSSENVRNKIFDFEFPIFDETYRPVLEKKILKHYYTREIGEETVELWKLRLDTRLNEIMPYYNKLYLSELIEFNPLYNVNYTRTGNKEGEVNTDNTENKEFNEGTTTDNTEVRTPQLTDTRTKNLTTKFDGDLVSDNDTETRRTSGVWDLYSDTPQGGIAGIENAETDPSVVTNGYLTNARHTFGDGNPDNTENDVHSVTDNTTLETGTDVLDRTGLETTKFDGQVDRLGSNSTTFDGKQNSTEDYLENVVGWNGSNPNKFLEDYRNNFLNIDMDIINRLQDLFLNLW